MASESTEVIQKHLYDKNSRLELFMNGNEITVLDMLTDKQKFKLILDQDEVQLFDGRVTRLFGQEKPPEYLCDSSLNSPTGKYSVWSCPKDRVMNAIIDINKDQRVMDLCDKDIGNPEGQYLWIENNGREGLFEFWMDIYGNIQHHFYIPENNKILKFEEMKINGYSLPKIFTYANTLVLEYRDFCGDMMDFLFFDCSSFENIKKLEGYVEDFQIKKKLKFKENNIISMTSYGDDYVGVGGWGVYQYKIKKDVFQRNGDKLVKNETKKYEIESDEIRQKRFDVAYHLKYF